MMEENRKGPGIFYAVTGVATLIVAIIGATFAYFSAEANVTGGKGVIQGGTNNELSTALTAEVTVLHHGAGATSGQGLVPSDLSSTPTVINSAVGKECIDDGYTGCHVYQIHVKSTQAVDAVELTLDSLGFDDNATPTDKDAWEFVIYRGNKEATLAGGTMAETEGLVADSSTSGFEVTDLSIRTDAMAGGQDYYYYLMVYIANKTNAAQNEVGDNYAIGAYNGTVSFSAAGGGQVSATFAG